MTISLEVFRQIPYFADLASDVLEDLTAQVRERTYRTDEVIFLEGEPCEELAFVIRGRVKVFKVSVEGREQVLRILGAGRTCNDIPLFDGDPNPASMAALELSTLGFIPKAQVLALVATYPQVAHAVIRVLASRLRALTLMVEDLALRGVAARVARVLLYCSQGREILMEGAPEACAHLTQQQLAAMTGSVREVVQRALKALERDGVIRLERARVQVLDPAALERWSESADLHSH